MSGIRPHLISSTDSRASGATMRMSAPSAICSPPPSAFPDIAAMTGTGTSVHTYAARCPVALAGPPPGGRSTRALSRSPSRMAWNEPKSRPAQKSGPAPDRTTARTPGSALSRSPAATRPANIAPSRALRFSGLLSRTSATPSVIVTLTRCSVMGCSFGALPMTLASAAGLPEVAGREQRAVLAQLAGRAAGRQLAVGQDVAAIGDLQRQVHVLLHQ